MTKRGKVPGIDLESLDVEKESAGNWTRMPFLSGRWINSLGRLSKSPAFLARSSKKSGWPSIHDRMWAIYCPGTALVLRERFYGADDLSKML